MISNECNIGSAMPTDRLREGLLAALGKGNPPDVEIAPHDVEGYPLASLLAVAVALVNGRSPSEMLIGTAAKVLGEDDIDVALFRGALKVTVPPMLSAVWFHALTLERAKVIEESPTTWNPPEKPGS